jgi:hypothetical protein
MNDWGLLGKTFQNYLRSGLDKGAIREMCRVLDDSGLYNESKALEVYLEARNISISRSGELDWDQRKCYSGLYPPQNPSLNDVWFDVVELTPMILIRGEGSPLLDHGFWLAMHPVYPWQFRGFWGSAKVRRKLIDVPSAADYLSAERIEGIDMTKFVTDIYHDEALAYTHWFGKFLSGQEELKHARHFLNENEFSQILPQGMRLWDESEFPASEFVRLAFGPDTLNKGQEDQYNEFMLRESGENKILQDRILFEEWERRDDIGFSTCVPLQLGLIDDLPRDSIFFEFRNAAPR